MIEIPRKPAPADYPVLEAIQERWSPYTFCDQSIEPEKVAALFEAARWAPSSFNEQPWRYIYALKGEPGRDALESLLSPGNAWAKDAGMLTISFARKAFTRNAKENRHHMHDLGAASGYFVLQAQSLGLITHQMAGFDWQTANQILGVPDDFMPGSMIAIGYPGDSRSIDPELQKREQAPRVRKKLEEFAFEGTWKT